MLRKILKSMRLNQRILSWSFEKRKERVWARKRDRQTERERKTKQFKEWNCIAVD